MYHDSHLSYMLRWCHVMPYDSWHLHVSWVFICFSSFFYDSSFLAFTSLTLFSNFVYGLFPPLMSKRFCPLQCPPDSQLVNMKVCYHAETFWASGFLRRPLAALILLASFIANSRSQIPGDCCSSSFWLLRVFSELQLSLVSHTYYTFAHASVNLWIFRHMMYLSDLLKQFTIILKHCLYSKDVQCHFYVITL